MSTPSRLACLAALLVACGDDAAERGDGGTMGDAAPRDAANDAADTSPCLSATLTAATTRAFVETLDHGTVYASLSTGESAAVEDATRLLLAGDRPAAASAATLAGYQLVPLAMGGECLLVLRPGPSAPAGQGTLIVRPGAARDLALEAPHVPNDGKTDLEAALVFDAVQARALAIAGANRCAVTTASGCHANTECNGAGIAVDSDVAHSTRSSLHAMHLALAAGPTLVLQLHTNLEPTLNGDALVSNGVHVATPQTTRAARFYAALKAAGADARSCNDAANPAPAGAFCGTTNAQGLASNGSADACTGSATIASDRFIHLEQYSRRLDQIDAWSAEVATALAGALPAGRP